MSDYRSRSALLQSVERVFPGLVKILRKANARQIEHQHWARRIADVIACPDSARLLRVARAGKVSGGYQVMHNGLEVAVDGYYGNGITRLLARNRGCHEPQEEVVFHAIVRSLLPASIMIEAGAYWGFYSLWFCQAVPRARVLLIEPVEAHLQVGRRNFARNHHTGEFVQAYVGATAGMVADGIPTLTIDSLAAEKELNSIAILHADIQGFEMEMLSGSDRLLRLHAIDYVFVSTHSNELHHACAALLRQHGYCILVSIDLDETYSLDGVLVACSPAMRPPPFEPPSRRPRKSQPH